MLKLTKRAVDTAIDDLVLLQLADEGSVPDTGATTASGDVEAALADAAVEEPAAEDNGADAWTDDPFMFSARFDTLDDLAFWAAQLTDLTACYAADPAAAIDGLGLEAYTAFFAELDAANTILVANGLEPAAVAATDAATDDGEAAAEDNGADAWTDDPFMFGARFASLDEVAAWIEQIDVSTAFAPEDEELGIEAAGGDFYYELMAERAGAVQYLADQGYVL